MNTMPSMGRGAEQFCAVESEVPAFATGCTLVVSKGTCPGHMKSGVRKVLCEDTVLNMTEINIEWLNRLGIIR